MSWDRVHIPVLLGLWYAGLAAHYVDYWIRYWLWKRRTRRYLIQLDLRRSETIVWQKWEQLTDWKSSEK